MKKLIAIAIAHTIAANAVATETDNRLETLTVTASRVEAPLRQIGSSISVLSQTDIESRGQSTVAELLRTLPAIGVTNSGGLGKQTALRIRGEEGYRTKVLVDGIDISDTSGTQIQPQIQHLLTADIEQIEVLRGPQGMMYGADAGGVVNIITKKADKPLQGGLMAEYGRYNTQQLAGNIRGKIEDFDYSLTASDLSTDGFNSRTSDTSNEADGYENTTIGFSAGYNINENFRLQAAVRDADAESEFDNCFAGFTSTNDCLSEFEQTSYKADAIYNNSTMEHKLSYAVSKTDRKNISNKTIKALDTAGELEQIQYLGSYNIAKTSKIVYGVDWEQESIDSDTNDERQQTGIYLEWQGNIQDSFYYTAGVRHDDNDDFGDHTSYRATGAYVLDLKNSNALKIKASYGTGFRAPSLFEIAYNNSPSASAPATLGSLDEEKSEGYDLGIEYHASNGLFVELVYFNQEITDAIEFDLTTFSGYLQDKGVSKSKGAELSFEMPLPASLNIYANYTYNDAKDSQGDQRARRPLHAANLGLSHSAFDGRLNTSIDARYAADAQNNIFGIGLVDLDDYHVVNLNVRYALLPELELYARGENILDEDYQEVTGFNTAGASVYGGFRYTF